MNKFLNGLAKIAEWAGGGDYFIGFVRIAVVILIVVVVVIVAAYV